MSIPTVPSRLPTQQPTFLSRAGEYISAGWHVVTDSGLALYALITSLAVTILNIFLPESAVNKITGAFGYVLAFFERIRGKVTEIKLSYAKEDLANAQREIERLNREKELGIKLLQKGNRDRAALVRDNERLKYEKAQLQFELKQAQEKGHVTFSYTPLSKGKLSANLVDLQKTLHCLTQQCGVLPKDSECYSTGIIAAHIVTKIMRQVEGTNALLSN